MKNIDKLQILIDRGEELKNTFYAKQYAHVPNTIISYDVEKLSQWLSEIIIFIEKNTTLREENNIRKHFNSAYSKVDRLEKNEFLRLIGSLKAIKEQFYTIELT